MKPVKVDGRYYDADSIRNLEVWRAAAEADREEIHRLRAALIKISELPGRRWQRKTAREALAASPTREPKNV